MAGITTFLDESKMPNRSQEQKVFDNLVAYIFQNFPTWGREVNESLAAFNAALAGGAYALPYVFDSATADSDPGAGKLRLSNATQNAATVMRLDLTAGGQDCTALLDTMASSTSAVKGSIRLMKQGDMNRWMTFDVTARAAPSGYRNLFLVCTGSSSANPFAAGDALMLFYQRNGDKGETGFTGMPVLGNAVVTSPVANIDFLNVFNSDFDKYTIEVQNIATSSGSARVDLSIAIAGAINNNFNSSVRVAGTEIGGSTTAYPVCDVLGTSSSNPGATFSIEIRSVNSGLKSISFRGMGKISNGNWFTLGTEAFNFSAASLTGFRLSLTAGNFVSGTVRIFGHRNS